MERPKIDENISSIPQFLSAFTKEEENEAFLKDILGNQRNYYFDEQNDLIFDRYNHMAIITSCKSFDEAIEMFEELQSLYKYILLLRKSPFIIQTTNDNKGKNPNIVNPYIIGCVNYEQALEDHKQLVRK